MKISYLKFISRINDHLMKLEVKYLIVQKLKVTDEPLDTAEKLDIAIAENDIKQIEK